MKIRYNILSELENRVDVLEKDICKLEIKNEYK